MANPSSCSSKEIKDLGKESQYHYPVNKDVVLHSKTKIVGKNSRMGREKQRYEDGRRLIVCILPLRENDEILMISSSKYPSEWIFPKGGWDNDETIEECVLREAQEEAGISAQIVSSLGTLDFTSNGGNLCRMYGYAVQVLECFQEWSEDVRSRKWVNLDDAIETMQREELKEMMMRYKKILRQ